MRRLLTSLVVLPLVACAASGRTDGPSGRQASAADSPLPLASLRAECSISKRWVGSAFHLPWGAWLDCGGRPVLLTHPLNLLDQVEIRRDEQALDFVRFFSLDERHILFDLDGLREVPGDGSGFGDDGGARLREALGDRLREPSIRTHESQQVCRDREGAEALCPARLFHVIRVVVTYDQNVYELVEAVRQNGFYTQVSKRLLFEDISRLGLAHEGLY